MLEAKNKNALSVAGTTNSAFLQDGVVSGGHNFHVYYITLLPFCKKKTLGKTSKKWEVI